MNRGLRVIVSLLVVIFLTTSVWAEVAEKPRGNELTIDIGAGVKRVMPGEHGWTELMEATFKGDAATVKALLNKKVDVNAKSDAGETALMVATYYGYIDIVHALLNAGADVNVKNIYGRTALSEAVDRGHMAIVQMLLNNGADVNMEGILEAASVRGQTEIVHALLNKGADVNKYGGAALISASWKGHTAIVEALLSKGANVNARTEEGKTALMLAAEEGHIATVETLLVRGAYVDARSDYRFGYGETALMFAAYRGHTGVVDVLLTKGAAVDAKANDGRTALMLAAEEGHTPVVQTLLAKGANVDYKNKYGSTVLMIAAQKGYEDTVQILLKNGADVKATDNQGQTALVYADWENHKVVVDILLTRETPGSKAASLIYLQEGKNRCDLKMWNPTTHATKLLHFLKDCPKGLFVDDERNTLFVIKGKTIQEIVFRPEVIIKPARDLPFKEGKVEVEGEQRWNRLSRVGYLKDGRLSVINERIRPADDSDIFLYALDNDTWRLIAQRYCRRFEDCTLGPISGHSWRVWRRESQIWHPMLSLNPFVIERGMAPHMGDDKLKRRQRGEMRYIKFSISGRKSILYYDAQKGDDSFGPYTFLIFLKTDSDTTSIELSDVQNVTAIEHKYLLLNRYFKEGLDLIELESGKRLLKGLRFAFWIY